MITQIKQKHIKNSIPFSPCHCPVARAVKEALDIPIDADEGDVEYVKVKQGGIVVFRHGEVIRAYKPTKKLIKFINTVDDRGIKHAKPTTMKFERDFGRES